MLDGEEKKSFWESPSLTFMGNLLAILVFFFLSTLKHSRFPDFSIPPPSHTSSFTWLHWEIPHNGQLVCTLSGKVCFFPPLGTIPLHFLEIVGVTVWYDGVFLLENVLMCFHAVFSILERGKRNNCWNTSAMRRMQI